MTNEEFLKKMKEVRPDLKALEEYMYSNTDTKFECLICGYVFISSPNAVLNLGKKCPECLAKENIEKYGSDRKIREDVPQRLKDILHKMKERCYRDIPKYKKYKELGIKVCDEWLKNSSAFYDWSMSHGYENNLTIDRIDPYGDYCPENCRWTTMLVQVNNRTNNIFVEIDGENLTLSQWCARYNIKYQNVYRKITKSRNPNIKEILMEEIEKSKNNSN